MRPTRTSGEEDKSLREEKAQEGRYFLPIQVLAGKKDTPQAPRPEVEASANHERVAAAERLFGLLSGKVPEGQNPMDVAGMKQGRRVAGGSRPRERRNAAEAP